MRYKLINDKGMYVVVPCDGSESIKFTFATIEDAERAKEIAYSGLGELDFKQYEILPPARPDARIKERKKTNQAVTRQLRR